jgi:hypothetical protein
MMGPLCRTRSASRRQFFSRMRLCAKTRSVIEDIREGLRNGDTMVKVQFVKVAVATRSCHPSCSYHDHDFHHPFRSVNCAMWRSRHLAPLSSV